MKKQVTIILLLLVFCFSLFSSTKVINATDNNLLSSQSYNNEQYGFSINPPEGWRQESNSQYITEFISDETVTACYLAVWCNLNVSFSLDGYYNFTVDNWKQLTNFSILSEDDLSIAGYQSKQIVYTCLSQNQEMKSKNVLFVENSNGYVIVYAGSSEVYDQYLPEFEQSIETFKAYQDLPIQGTDVASIFYILIGATSVIVVLLVVIVLLKKRKPKSA